VLSGAIDGDNRLRSWLAEHVEQNRRSCRSVPQAANLQRFRAAKIACRRISASLAAQLTALPPFLWEAEEILRERTTCVMASSKN
jgi:hypothetical protein